MRLRSLLILLRAQCHPDTADKVSDEVRNPLEFLRILARTLAYLFRQRLGGKSRRHYLRSDVIMKLLADAILFLELTDE